MEWFNSCRLSVTLVNYSYYPFCTFILLLLYSYSFLLRFQVCLDHGIIYHHIKTIRTSCVKFTLEDYFTLSATRIHPRTPRLDTELDSRKIAEGSPVPGYSSIAGRFILHMRHYRDYIYEDALSGLNYIFLSL